MAAVARGMAETRRAGKKILFVGGPAIIHTGAGTLPRAAHRAAGWIDVLFAGNALATHDIESALLGTSLGVRLDDGRPDGERPQPPPARDQQHPRAPAASAPPWSRACSRAASCTSA